jgi:tetratricopeptide (TPR) repeat protein
LRVAGCLATPFYPRERRLSFLDVTSVAGEREAGARARELQENPTPGQLLTATYEVIPFREAGREEELAALAAWCEDAARRDVLLLTGEGGAGKTRLAIEWCRRLRHRGWHAGFLRWDRQAADLDLLLAGAAPRLIVLDYAETRPTLLTELLYKMALDRGTGPRVRLLLLSRRAGDWWDALRRGDERSEIAALLAPSEPRAVTPLISGKEERRRAFREAADAFALARGGKLPRQLPEPPFENPDFDRALYLHMAALAALDSKTIASADQAREETLDHERRFWLKQVREMGLDAGLARWMRAALGQAIAALTLTGGGEESRARELLGQVLTPPAGRTDLVDLAADVLRRQYGWQPEQGPELVEPLRPDLLGEELVEHELKAADLLDRVLDNATPAEASNALTALARLAQRRNETAWLAAAFRGERLERLAELALEVAVETGDPVGMVLAREIEKRASGELARRLMDRCDEDRYLPSVWLREIGLASTRRCYELLPKPGSLRQADETALVERAQLANKLGYRLSALGRREEALSATEEAVALRRTLSARRPDNFLPDLVRSLNNLGYRLSDLGRREDALSAMEEAVAHYRTLSSSRTDAFLSELATILNNLGNALSDLGRREEALSASEEAVALYRTLLSTRPDALPELAASLNNLGNRLSDLSRREEALSATEEAVALRRMLLSTRPDAFLPPLASSLNNLGNALSDLGRQEEALLAAEESVALRRTLSSMRPEAFLPDLAISLNNLGRMLSDLGRREEALLAIEESVALRRTLSATRPDTFLPALGKSLNNLGKMLSELGRREEALSAVEEGVRILVPFFTRHSAAFREWMEILAHNYLRFAEAAGQEPNRELLAPLLEPLGLTLDPPPAQAP